MHDPLVVAWEIPLPIPRLSTLSLSRNPSHRWGIYRWRYSDHCASDPDPKIAAKANQPIHPWFRPHAWELYVAGRRVRARTFCTIWHKEPHDADSGEICSHWKVDLATGKKIRDENGHLQSSNAWKWHVHHWHLQFPWLQGIRRRLFQRCAWCGGRDRRKDPVNCTYQWDGAERKHFWSSSPDLYHSDCMTPEHAWRSCSCAEPLTPLLPSYFETLNPEDRVNARADHGPCARCGRYFGWGTTRDKAAVYYYIRDTTPPNTRMSAVTKAEVHRRWAEIREKEKSE